ncbi:MAG: class I SAM-dependent methyltransferase [Candidatus Latescibacteria bacterium]|nr:class I SAM-dependent methyltransferase [Candidatus Latescibacterota bacterium]
MLTEARIKRFIPKPLHPATKVLAGTVKRRYAKLRDWISRPNLYRLSTPERVGVIYGNPTEMSLDERLLLFALIRGHRPERALEIGTRQGGSAAIITCAMEDNGAGRLIGVDPNPDITVNPRVFHGRFHLIARPSPEAVAEAREAAGGPFDFVLIDGVHVYDQVTKDIEGCLPHLTDGAYLLLHDAFNYGVREAIRAAIQAHSSLHDCGYVGTTVYTSEPLLTYRGLRLLRFDPSPIADPQPLVEAAYRVAGKPVPPADPDLLNHDEWYCRTVQPCPYCQKIRV